MANGLAYYVFAKLVAEKVFYKMSAWTAYLGDVDGRYGDFHTCT